MVERERWDGWGEEADEGLDGRVLAVLLRLWAFLVGSLAVEVCRKWRLQSGLNASVNGWKGEGIGPRSQWREKLEGSYEVNGVLIYGRLLLATTEVGQQVYLGLWTSMMAVTDLETFPFFYYFAYGSYVSTSSQFERNCKDGTGCMLTLAFQTSALPTNPTFF